MPKFDTNIEKSDSGENVNHGTQSKLPGRYTLKRGRIPVSGKSHAEMANVSAEAAVNDVAADAIAVRSKHPSSSSKNKAVKTTELVGSNEQPRQNKIALPKQRSRHSRDTKFVGKSGENVSENYKHARQLSKKWKIGELFCKLMRKLGLKKFVPCDIQQKETFKGKFDRDGRRDGRRSRNSAMNKASGTRRR